MSNLPLHLFDAFGVELEYMIVDRDTLNIVPICDRLLACVNDGQITGEVEFGRIAWSNELTLHIVEMKTAQPDSDLNTLASAFQDQIACANSRLADFNAQLMPTAMHPWMQPNLEMKLWPHDYSPVYEAYNRIFNCQGHGWANLQSTHWNFPFVGDQEFGQLHAAIRLILPLLPAIAASSPFMESRATGKLDSRLDVYQANSAIIPSITGLVIPEAVFSEADYENEILIPMYRDIAPLDPEQLLQQIFLNSRGAIARFDRGAIEIRILDIQECPAADLAIGKLIAAALQALVDQRWSDSEGQKNMSTQLLAQSFQATLRYGGNAIIPSEIAKHFGWNSAELPNAQSLWQAMRAQLSITQTLDSSGTDPLDIILNDGSLARRILNKTGCNPSPTSLHDTYKYLCHCLANGKIFE